MITHEEALAALRRIEHADPAEAAKIRAYLDELSDSYSRLANKDAFAAYVTQSLGLLGKVHSVLGRIDTAVVGPLMQAEADKRAAELIAAEQRREGHRTARGVLTEPVVLALVGVLTTLAGTFASAVTWWINSAGG